MEAFQMVRRRLSIVRRNEDSERVSMVRTLEARALLSTRNFQRGWVSQVISAAGNASRSAATAGKVWTISPREPKRRTRKRNSGMRGLTNGVDEFAGGVIFRVTDNGYLYAKAGGGCALRYGVGCVVGAFGVDVGMEKFQEGFDVGFAKQYHVIDGAKCSYKRSARGLWQDGT